MTFWGPFFSISFWSQFLPTFQVSRSQVLSESASSFRRDAEQLRRLVWWGNVKKMALLISIVVSKLESWKEKNLNLWVFSSLAWFSTIVSIVLHILKVLGPERVFRDRKLHGRFIFQTKDLMNRLRMIISVERRSKILQIWCVLHELLAVGWDPVCRWSPSKTNPQIYGDSAGFWWIWGARDLSHCYGLMRWNHLLEVSMMFCSHGFRMRKQEQFEKWMVALQLGWSYEVYEYDEM